MCVVAADVEFFASLGDYKNKLSFSISWGFFDEIYLKKLYIFESTITHILTLCVCAQIMVEKIVGVFKQLGGITSQLL